MGVHISELMERFLAIMEVGVGAFTSCDVRLGHQLAFEACSTASLHYCLSGKGTMRLSNGLTIAMQEHSFVLLPPGIVYTIAANESEQNDGSPHPRLRAPLFRESIPTIQAGEGQAGILTACGEISIAATSPSDFFAQLASPIVEHFDEPGGLRNQFVILLAESLRPGIGTRALTEALLKQCLILLLRRQIDRGTPPVPWMAALTDPGLARALQAILERSRERFTVEALASIAGMSRSAFAVRFAEVFGQTPMGLLKSVRLHHARELLVMTNKPIDQIAHSVGFASRSNFSHAFRMAYGIDPTKFRAVSLSNGDLKQ